MPQLDKKLVSVDQAESVSKSLGDAISDYFRQVRGDRNMSQSELASRLGVSTQTIKSLEVGRTRWNVENMVKVAAGLSAPPAEVFQFAADHVRDNAPGIEQADAMLAQLIECYERRDLPGMLHVMGVLSTKWGQFA